MNLRHVTAAMRRCICHVALYLQIRPLARLALWLSGAENV